jgi:hypothetical protein
VHGLPGELSVSREPSKSVYAPRRPEESILYGVVAGHLESFLARARDRERIVPRFVEREFRSFLDCGILAHGFLRVRCDRCKTERFVAFSCKGRGFCPSCGGRRMADTAAHLVDRVFPEAPVRQWVLTLPWALRYRMAYDPALTSAVLNELVRAVSASLRRRARRRWRLAPGTQLRCGAVTFVQRFGDALNVNVHFHSLALDGVFVLEAGDPHPEGSRPRFRALPPPEDREVDLVAARIARRIAVLLKRRGLTDDGDPTEVDPLFVDQPFLAALAGASVRGHIATGRRAGQTVLRFGDRIDPEDMEPRTEDALPARCARVAGLSVHANVAVPARDRRRLERLCRYVARPPLSGERLSRLDDGRLLYRLKKRWSDGTTAMVFEPQELIEKLAALVPPPRLNLVRYHGVLAPAARRRRDVVPPSASDQARRKNCCDSGAGKSRNPSSTTCTRPVPSSPIDLDSTASPRPRRYNWQELMRRVFEIDVLECPKCGGRTMRILAQIHPPETTTAILDWLNLPCRPPPIAAAEPTELAIAMTDADADADAAIDEAFDPPHDSHEF